MAPGTRGAVDLIDRTCSFYGAPISKYTVIIVAHAYFFQAMAPMKATMNARPTRANLMAIRHTTKRNLMMEKKNSWPRDGARLYSGRGAFCGSTHDAFCPFWAVVGARAIIHNHPVGEY